MPQGSFEASSSRNGGAQSEIRPNLIALVSLTHTLCEAGRVQEAEELCRLILKEQPGLAIAQAGLGRALYEAGKLDEAEICLERTVGQTPGCFAAHRWLAEVLVQKGAWDHAQTVLTQAAVLSPDNPRVRQLLQTLPIPPPSANAHAAASANAGAPAATEPGRPAHTDDRAAQVERPQPRRPRTTEYPPPEFEEMPFVAMESVGPDDVEDFVTEPHVGKLRPIPPANDDLAYDDLAYYEPTPRLRTRLLDVLRRQDWRAVGAAAAVGLGLAMALGVAFWVMGGPAPTPLSPPSRASAPAPLSSKPPPPLSTGATTARRALDEAIGSGDLPALLAAADQASLHLGVPEVAAARVFTAALLATEYGMPVPEDTHMLLRRLLETAPQGRVASEVAASRLLLALAAGHLDVALPTDEQIAETPWLAFAVAKARRLSGDSAQGRTATTEDLGPAIVLQAEALLDAGEIGRARALLTTLLDRVPAQSRARLALAEARLASAAPPSPEETTSLRGACALDGPRSPIVEGACKLIAAEEARRAGERLTARTRAAQVVALDPPDGRLLARTAQLFLNLGETKRAQDVVTRALTLANPSYPPLAWANVGLRLNRGEPVRADELPAPPVGPEERVLAARAALARGGAAGVGNTLKAMDARQVNGDPDLAWFLTLSRIHQRRSAIRLAEQFRAPGARPVSPVGSYVLGLLARWGERRHLAAYWLNRARDGHGDACSAAALYVAAESDIGRRPPPGVTPPDCVRKKKR